ncbi:hypothetical protein GCK72_014728 [Caenorhabditis remanei]|uniref:Uncharacterized protein n=1 Tax=Caenorhabditis remanei TaxID=31234 RepID=A0A6A5GS87_CAERE|nr:hypothetical protein GCK72_014728 [Caenorhabditis remanei]KAF1758270.1 hypothetical protein GCK72_014728 [Caenorhabditis remanei]
MLNFRSDTGVSKLTATEEQKVVEKPNGKKIQFADKMVKSTITPGAKNRSEDVEKDEEGEEGVSRDAQEDEGTGDCWSENESSRLSTNFLLHISSESLLKLFTTINVECNVVGRDGDCSSKENEVDEFGKDVAVFEGTEEHHQKLEKELIWF